MLPNRYLWIRKRHIELKYYSESYFLSFRKPPNFESHKENKLIAHVMRGLSLLCAMGAWRYL